MRPAQQVGGSIAAPRRVLVVDDAAGIRRVVAGILSRFRHVIVVIMSGNLTINQPEAIAAGCDAMLAKPFRPYVLLDTLSQLLIERRIAGTPPNA
jgi:CheY-like chemotaxis protein